MARLVRGCLTACSQSEDAKEPETNPSVPQQEEHPDATEGKVMVDYNPNIDYYLSEPRNEPVAQEEKEENSDAEHGNMEIPPKGTDDALQCYAEDPAGTSRIKT